jgi:hypothetical protein
MRLLESPGFWRPFVEGYGQGASLVRTIALAGWLFMKSIVGRRSRREPSLDPQGGAQPSLFLILLWTGIYSARSLFRRVVRSTR